MTGQETLLPLEAHVVFSNDIVVRENKDGTVIAMKMDDGDMFYKIDGVAAELFKDLRKDQTLKSSFEKIQNSYQVDANKLHGDISVFLRQLIKLGFVTLE